MKYRRKKRSRFGRKMRRIRRYRVSRGGIRF